MIHEIRAGEADWLARCEALHRQLRPQLPADYAGLIRTMLAEGAGMAVLHAGGAPQALAIWRHHHTTFHGHRFYLDDLVADEAARGRGHGAALLAWCQARATALGCDTFALESGPQRGAAHRFYFRHGFTISSFGFSRASSLPWTG